MSGLFRNGSTRCFIRGAVLDLADLAHASEVTSVCVGVRLGRGLCATASGGSGTEAGRHRTAAPASLAYPRFASTYGWSATGLSVSMTLRQLGISDLALSRLGLGRGSGARDELIKTL